MSSTEPKPDAVAPAPARAADRRSAQEIEYGTYVAVRPIDLNGVRAFNVGDPVPVSHVDRGVVVDEDVAKTSTKAAATARAVASGEQSGE